MELIQQTAGYLSNEEKALRCLGYFFGDEILLFSYVGMIMNHYKDPYETTSV